MRARHLITLDAPTRADALDPFHRQLSAALDGSGPAILPLPPGPEALRSALVEAARVDRPLEQDDVCLVVATSGSTGAPKLAMLTADAVAASARATAEVVGGPSTWVLALPLSSIGGLQVLVRSIDADTYPVLIDLSEGFSPSAFTAAAAQLDHARNDGVCATSLVPTQLYRLLDDPAATAALGRLDVVLLGGAQSDPSLLERAADHGVPVVTTYGMTETSGGCVYDGHPLPGVGVRLDANGHVVLSGPTLFTGYRLEPTLTSQVLRDRELHTQDLGLLDQAGRLTVLGRDDDVVVSGGVNVSCVQVEAVLSSHPGIAEVVVVGVPDPEWGQQVVAAFVPTAPGLRPTLAQLRDFGATQLPAAALPRRVLGLDALPLLTSGKPDRAAVRTLATGSESRSTFDAAP
jgi:O-succinylbenzoic acid--CoA ligase